VKHFQKKKGQKRKAQPSACFSFSRVKDGTCAAGLRFRREIATGGILCRFFAPFFLGKPANLFMQHDRFTRIVRGIIIEDNR
jgi:hypothetical protein